MKSLISVLLIAAFASFSFAAEPQMGRTFNCRGPIFHYSNAPTLIGAPSMRIIEQLVPMGPMLPAFEHHYYLQVKPLNPMVPANTFRLEYKSQKAAGVHIYKALNSDGQEAGYGVQHNFLKDPMTFQVHVNSSMYYECK